MKYVEKHSTGVTFGIGNDGKLWVLRKANNAILESYKGSVISLEVV